MEGADLTGQTLDTRLGSLAAAFMGKRQSRIYAQGRYNR